MDEIYFDDIYRGFVIRKKNNGYFIGENSHKALVMLRLEAARFTKKDAVEYIKTGEFCKNGEFVIEDAI